MSANNGFPCNRCGANDWYDSGRCRECKRIYYIQNREEILRRNAVYELGNRDVRKAIKQRRRARKQLAPGSFTAEEWHNLCRLYDFSCLSCQLQMRYDELTVDHVIPLSVGGTNWLKNLQPLCSSCNSSKHTKHIDYRTNWAIPEWRILGYIKES